MVALVQTAAFTGVGSVTSITSAAFGAATTLGNKLVCKAFWWNSAGGNPTVTMSDSNVNTWTQDKTIRRVGTGAPGATIASAPLTVVGAGSTVKITTSLSCNIQGVAQEWSGLGTAVDVSNTNTGASGNTNLSVATGTNTGPGLLVAALNGHGTLTNSGISDPPTVAGSTTGVNSDFINQDGTVLSCGEGCYSILSGIAAQTVNWTFTTSTGDGFVGAVVVYKAAPAVATGQQPNLRGPGFGPDTTAKFRYRTFASQPVFPSESGGSAISRTFGTGALLATAALAGTSISRTLATGSLGGAGALAGASISRSNATGPLTGSGFLSGNSISRTLAAGALLGAGALGGTAIGRTLATGALLGSGTLSGVAISRILGTGDLQNQPSGAISGIAISRSFGAGALLGAGALAGAAIARTVATGILNGDGQLVGLSISRTLAGGLLLGSGDIQGIAIGRSLVTGGPLTGAGALAGISATYSLAVGNLVATGVPVFPDPADVRFGVTYGPTGADFTGTMVAGTGTAFLRRR